jgi:hypothetical protein
VVEIRAAAEREVRDLARARRGLGRGEPRLHVDALATDGAARVHRVRDLAAVDARHEIGRGRGPGACSRRLEVAEGVRVRVGDRRSAEPLVQVPEPDPDPLQQEVLLLGTVGAVPELERREVMEQIPCGADAGQAPVRALGVVELVGDLAGHRGVDLHRVEMGVDVVDLDGGVGRRARTAVARAWISAGVALRAPATESLGRRRLTPVRQPPEGTLGRS